MSKIEEGNTTENIELTDTAPPTRDAHHDGKFTGEKGKSVAVNLEEENANIDKDEEAETRQ